MLNYIMKDPLLIFDELKNDPICKIRELWPHRLWDNIIGSAQIYLK